MRTRRWRKRSILSRDPAAGLFHACGHGCQADAVWEVPFMVTMTKGQDCKSRPGLGERRYKPEESNLPQERGSHWNFMEREIRPNQSSRKCA